LTQALFSFTLMEAKPNRHPSTEEETDVCHAPQYHHPGPDPLGHFLDDEERQTLEPVSRTFILPPAGLSLRSTRCNRSFKKTH
jgi:hypothetical protein